MEYLWYFLILFLFAGYVVLDGFDLGAGLVHLFVARNEQERRQVLAAIGPYWDGNEVWLIAAGGTLFFTFPPLFAAAFSGFYLPLMLVLWCLLLRGIAIEFRNHIQHPAWTPAWDMVFALASILLCFLFGAAAGNIVRGVPLDKEGEFFLPLWTSFLTTGDLGVLDWYTTLTAIFAAAALGMHGTLWIALKVPQPFEIKVIAFAERLWPMLVGLAVLTTAATACVRPGIFQIFERFPITVLFPISALASLTMLYGLIRSNQRQSFQCSSAMLVCFLLTAAITNFPVILPSTVSPDFSLTIANSKTSAYGMESAMIWWIPGMCLVIGYFVFLYRRFAGKIAHEIETSDP